jgi:hypothetical protein
MFDKNVEFRVTIRDFQDRQEPHVLKQAGREFLRAVRESSAEYLENCFKEEGVVDIDAELRWTVTLHQKLGIGTIHYVVFREGMGFEGKCLVWDLEKGPVPNRPWTPITMRAGELKLAYDDINVRIPGVSQPGDQMFSSYLFKGWIPVSRITADMVEENTERTLIGAGFSPNLVLGTPELPMGMMKALGLLRDQHNAVVKSENLKLKETAAPQLLAAREYEFDLRPAKDTLTMKVNYLKVNPVEELRVTSFEAIFQEGGWLDGGYAKASKDPQFTDLYTWASTVDFDEL